MFGPRPGRWGAAADRGDQGAASDLEARAVRRWQRVEAARRLRGRVAGLVWVDAYRKLDAPPSAERIEAFVAPFRDDFHAAVAAFLARIDGEVRS